MKVVGLPIPFVKKIKYHSSEGELKEWEYCECGHYKHNHKLGYNNRESGWWMRHFGMNFTNRDCEKCDCYQYNFKYESHISDYKELHSIYLNEKTEIIR